MKNILFYAVLTGICWGMYGDSLARARGALQSPFKPYLMIGVAYLVWAILGGAVGMMVRGESFTFTGPGVRWGFIAGTLGAWGALTLTMAMVSGGARQPHIVMATVFGSAVTVAALVAWFQAQHASPGLWFGIGLILVGVVVTSYYTPHKVPPAPKAQASVPLANTLPGMQ